jgi:hypothetical protein
MILPVLSLRFPQTEAHGWSRAAFCSIRRAAARTEHRHQRFARLAGHRSVALDGTKFDSRRITLVALIAFFSLSTLRTLRSLRTRDALRTLRASRTLWARFTFRAGISAACGE